MKIHTLDRLISNLCPNVLTAISNEVEGIVRVCDGVNVFEIDSKECAVIGNSGIKSKFDFLKMYVVVDSSAPVGLGINGAVHCAYAAGSIAAGEINNESIKFDPSSESNTKRIDWIKNSYRNVTCVGTSEEIDLAIVEAENKGIPYYAFFEPDWFESNNRPLAVAFGPEYVWPDVFSKFELHGGTIRRPDRNPR